MPMQEIDRIKDCFVAALHPRRIYLFGSFASGTACADSDFDFYIVVDNERKNWHALTTDAYRCIRAVRSRPVDILVGTEDDFNERRIRNTIEKEVAENGVLIYAA